MMDFPSHLYHCHRWRSGDPWQRLLPNGETLVGQIQVQLFYHLLAARHEGRSRHACRQYGLEQLTPILQKNPDLQAPIEHTIERILDATDFLRGLTQHQTAEMWAMTTIPTALTTTN